MKRVTIHPEANAELREAAANDERQRAGLGREFLTEFQRVKERIQQDPTAMAVIDEEGTRKYRLRRFPNTVFYADLEDRIWIAAVAHQKRRPGYWSGREP